MNNNQYSYNMDYSYLKQQHQNAPALRSAQQLFMCINKQKVYI